MGILDILIQELNKDKKEGEPKIERLYSEQYRVCENGSHKNVKTGKFVKDNNKVQVHK